MAGATPNKIRVAIIGGGCAGLSAAWQLSQQPGYEIHVYEKSWRLGGKGASVRDADGRILEHGLHVWFGFYENAFKMMRECYAEVERRNWGPGPETAEKLAHGRIEDALLPEPNVGVAHPGFQGEWAFWSGLFPPDDGLPGTPIDERANPFTVANYLLRCFSLLKTLTLSVIGPPNEAEPSKPASNDAAAPIAVLIERMIGMLRVGSLTGAAVLLQAVTILEVWVRSFNLAPRVAGSAVQLAEALAAQTRKLLRDVAMVDQKIRTRTEIIEIVMTIAVGLLRDGILFDERGLDAINQHDYRDWLRSHGATDTAIESRFLVAAYDLVFGYRNGDRNKPAFAAGVALRGALRMFFTYRGSMFWRMGSGMGDAVFAPLYRVLMAGRALEPSPMSRAGEPAKTEGPPSFSSPVQFHFLHELSKIALDVSQDQSRYVVSMDFATQGDEKELDEQSKDALDKFGCWPETAEARFGGAIEKGPGRKALLLGPDFDRVIFAMGIEDFKKAGGGELPNVTGGDSTSPADWRKMCYEVKTVATKSAQVWLQKDLEGLGWDRGSGLITALGLSFSTWADMTPTLTSERAWRGPTRSALDAARSVAYFCDVLPDGEIEKLQREVRGEAVQRIRAELSDTAKALRLAASESPEMAARQRRAALEAVLKIHIPRVLHGPIDAVLSKLLDGIARLGDEGTAEAISDRLTAASDSFEADLFIASLEIYLEHELDKLLAKEMHPVWPRVFAHGQTAIDSEISRHLKANIEGSDRYTQSLPSSIACRVSPLNRSVENMTIAGDWTACGLDVGCVEAAVMSGMLAAYAISGKPDPRSIIGYNHP